MLSPSTMRLAAASVAIVLASTASAQHAVIQGRPDRLSELPPGQELSLYVPEARPAVATEAGAAVQPVRLANTAGWMPRLALVGALAVIGSLALTTRWRPRNAAVARGKR